MAEALLLDQFGVLHDGRRPYPGAVEAVSAAAAAGLRLLIISNSSRRSGGTLDKLASMGFDRQCFEGVVTSGELTHRYLTSRPDAWWAGLGRRVFHINWSKRGPASLEGFDLEVVSDPRDADFLLAHGTEAVTVDGDELVAMPGSLAAAYSAAGGRVVLMGKPAPLIYAACGQLLGLPAGELLAVGDSLEHDIAGACAAGIDSLFIAGGIHARELMPQAQGPAAGGAAGGADDGAGADVDMDALRRLCEHHLNGGSDGEGGGGAGGGARRAPTYVAQRFVW
ncbi:hypothetical protein GPECTOR_305g833 [Gonium pectorale]|uniref:Uncharacterized protein n=1 Tax=Gonium pectorale TaxID=33097 RepID=A0A150FWY9_GONPE|nr:hypothetical protein GPECTOR_305g833 [Gonium pectorale]|eukprot:KXZ41725.1 hypothetical protein GPECTOR_305g833 [Gonium pectorale]